LPGPNMSPLPQDNNSSRLKEEGLLMIKFPCGSFEKVAL
jgi:hypothetical protein